MMITIRINVRNLNYLDPKLKSLAFMITILISKNYLFWYWILNLEISLSTFSH